MNDMVAAPVEEKKVALVKSVTLRIAEARGYCAGLKLVDIGNEEQHDSMVASGGRVSKYLKELTEEKRAIKRKVDAYFAVVLEDLGALDAKIRASVSKYVQWKQEQQRRLQRQMEQQAEAERQKRQRLAEERQKKAEEYRAEGKEGMALRMEMSAEAAEEEAMMIAAAVVSVDKSSGSVLLTRWKAEVIDEDAFFKHLMAQDRVREFYRIHQSSINQEATRIKDTKQVPGLRIWSETRTRFTKKK